MLILLAGTSGHKHTDGRACRHMLLGVCVKELVMRVFRTSLYPQLIASTFSYGSSYWEEGEEEEGEWVGYSPLPTPRPSENSNCSYLDPQNP